jgi:Ca2+-binding RTX toxin-like protein
LGNDTLTGGDGNDIFLFNKAAGSTNLDTITDFTSGADVVQLSKSIFKGFSTTGTLAESAFYAAVGATSGQDASDRIIYNTTTGALYYDADGNGSGLAVQIAIVGSQPTIAYTDIAIVS